jgi:chaperonin GroEL (HSP60 family)
MSECYLKNMNFILKYHPRKMNTQHNVQASNILTFISRQLIYNYPEQLFADAGVMAIEHADFEGVERLALVLGAEIVSTFGKPELVKLGHCKLIEEVMIGEDQVSADWW